MFSSRRMLSRSAFVNHTDAVTEPIHPDTRLEQSLNNSGSEPVTSPD